MAAGEFENRELQSSDLLFSIAPKGNDVGTGSLPGGASGNNVPSYPVEVVSTYPVIPLNAKEFDVETSDLLDSLFSGPSAVPGVAQLSFTPPPGYVAVIKMISWNVNPRRFFLSNLGSALLTINGIASDAIANVVIADAGIFSTHIIIPEDSTVIFKADFSGTYGTVTGTKYTMNNVYASRCHMRMYGHLLFSRGLPANFEIGS